jgi:DNA repair exonuclease SbcCD ATPase subunit
MANEQTSIVVAPAPEMLARYGADIVDAIVGKAEEYSGLTFDTRENYESSNKVLRTVITARTGIEKRRVELKAAPLKECTDIDAAAKYLTTLVEPIERQLKAKKDVVDNEKARIAAARKAEEEARVRAEAEAKLKAEADRLAVIEAEQKRVAAEQAAKELALKAQQYAIDEANRKAEAERRAADERAAQERQAAADKAAAEQAAKERAAQEEIDRKRREVEAEARRVAEARASAERLERDRLDRIERDRIAEEARAAAAIAEARRIERERVETEEARVAHLEQMAALKKREEALRPDKEKLAAYAATVREVAWPEVVDVSASEFMLRKLRELEGILTALESYEG